MYSINRISLVESSILSSNFSYLQPYFYSNPYALRCELGIGNSDGEYIRNAKERAMQIFNILFPNGVDAIIFNYWHYDYCDTTASASDDDDWTDLLENTLETEVENLRFLLTYQHRYRHTSIHNLKTYNNPDDADYEKQKRTRVICYSDGKGFNISDLITREIEVVNGHETGFVSFGNECILSIYDDRGCDVVFMTREKMREFYKKLEPFFLEYDREEMRQRYSG